GHDGEAVRRAIEEARSVTDKPSLICCKTIIGFGAPNAAGTHGVHGAPLGANEIAASRDFLKWPHAPFEVPQENYAAYDARAKGSEMEQAWNQEYVRYKATHPDLASELERRLAGELPASWAELVEQALASTDRAAATISTRKASENALDQFGPHLSELI